MHMVSAGPQQRMALAQIAMDAGQLHQNHRAP